MGWQAPPPRNSATTPTWPGDGGMHPTPWGQCGLSRTYWDAYRAAAGQGQDDEASSQGADPAGGGARGGARGGAAESRWWGWGRGGRGLRGCAGSHSFLSSCSVPSPPSPPPPVAKKPLAKGGAKAAQEAEAKPAPEAVPGSGHRPAQDRAVVRSGDPEPRRAEPSREIRNIIRMYQSRPGPVPVPVQPSRCALVGWGAARAAHSPGGHPVGSRPLRPLRKPPQSFLKKNNPKDEALAKLGINGDSPASVRPAPSRARRPRARVLLRLPGLNLAGSHSPRVFSAPPQTPSPSPGKGPPPAVAPRPKAPPRLGPSNSIREKQGPLCQLFSQTPPTTQKTPPPPPPPLPPPWEPGTPPAEPRGKEAHSPGRWALWARGQDSWQPLTAHSQGPGLWSHG